MAITRKQTKSTIASNMATTKRIMTSATTNQALPKKSYAAAHAVINTPELLENILLRLPMKRLLLTQRVNQQFRATIDGSSKLQQALFFQLAGGDGRRYGRQGTNPLALERNIYLERKSQDFEGRYFYAWIDESFDSDEDSEEDLEKDLEQHSTRRCPKVAMQFHDLSKKPESRDESWRKMYLFHSPSARETCVVVRPVEYGLPHIKGRFNIDRTATLGELFEKAWKKVEKDGLFGERNKDSALLVDRALEQFLLEYD